jgi:hypothetical protein
MAFQPFTSFGTLAKTVLPNTGNSATVTIPSGTAAAPTDAVAVSAPVAPVTPTTPVVASGPTKPITGTVVAPIVDISLRGVHSTWEAALAAFIVLVLLPAVGVNLPAGAAFSLTGLLTGLAAVARSFLSHKTIQKPP